MLPEFPQSDEDRQQQSEAAPNGVNVPSEVTFAQEVRTERLSILWKVTLFVAVLGLWAAVVMTGGTDINLARLLIPTAIVGLSCMLTGQFLTRDRFDAAVWVYSLGLVVGAAVIMGQGGDFEKKNAPYILPLVVFMTGLLMSVRDTLLLTVITLAVALFVPSSIIGEVELTSTTGFALILTLIAAGLSAQVSGELYAIAEWALENYRKERHTTMALFESRLALEKSLLRQQGLTQQLQEINRELEHARKSEEEAKNFRGQFLANMSHELRTPLNAIIGFSQTMLDFPAMYDGTELPVQYRQDMNQILSSGKHLLNIINDILDLSKVDAGKLDLEIQPVDLEPVIKSVLSTAIGLVGDRIKQVQLLRELPDPLPMVMGDPLRVRQVLLNLYSNASKFTDAGHIKLRILQDNGEVIFGVEDTGIGISEVDKATIFQEFRQGTAGRKKGRQGAGLGLAISQQLLRLMDGRIWFESTVGKGSTFFFALKQYVPETTSAESPGAATPAAEPTTVPTPATPTAS